jgi:tetratricopeptide (TPR) repeat protein
MARERFADVKFLKGILDYGPFCNSDKYSFLLAFESVLNQIPENVREMLNRGEAMMVQKVDKDEMESPAYIRRIYLQDLFRFFRLFPQRGDFRNFFTYEMSECLFFHYRLFFFTKLQDQFYDIICFLIKRNRHQDARKVLECYEDEKYYNYDFYMLSAYLRHGKELDYRRALELNPDSEQAMWGLAREVFGKEKYDEALDLYDKLLAINPDKKLYLLNKSVCLTNLRRYDEAEQILFRLNYEDSDNLNVARVLAWALTCDGKYEQAGRLYDQLMAVDLPASGDLLNYGFYLWFNDRIDEAASCFRSYGKDVYDLIKKEEYLLDKNGIIDEEIKMMFDLIGV